jgi:hypothetical protein
LAPEKSWLLHFLSTYLPHDEIFDKDYKAPSKNAKTPDQKVILVNKSVIEGLPQLVGKRKKRTRLKTVKEAKGKVKLMKKAAIRDKIIAEYK